MNCLLLCPDPPGTINPAKLSADASWAQAVLGSPQGAPLPEASVVQAIPAAPPARHGTAPGRPRLPRISSEWDPRDDAALNSDLEYNKLKNEFELRFAEDLHRYSPKVRAVSHRGYFRRQTIDGEGSYHISPDPDVPNAWVVVDRPTASIYDAFLLWADIAHNRNAFYRQQVGNMPFSSDYLHSATDESLRWSTVSKPARTSS